MANILKVVISESFDIFMLMPDIYSVVVTSFNSIGTVCSS